MIYSGQGPRSLALLKVLSRQIENQQVMIVANYRDDEAPDIRMGFAQCEANATFSFVL